MGDAGDYRHDYGTVVLVRKSSGFMKEGMKDHEKQKIAGKIVYHLLVGIGAFIMVYPLLWMVMSSFKETNTIFDSRAADTKQFTLENYQNGWRGFGKVSFGTFFKIPFSLQLWRRSAPSCPPLLWHTASHDAAFGKEASVCRNAGIHDAPGPGTYDSPVLMVSEAGLGWDVSSSDCPLLLCYSGIFVYLIMNFINGIPTELDEAAKIDGCSYYSIFFGSFSTGSTGPHYRSHLFFLCGDGRDFLSPLLYVNKSERYPISLALKLFCIRLLPRTMERCFQCRYFPFYR